MTSSPEKIREGRRFHEIISIVSRHQLSQGLTPDKLRAIFEELGPTFVKFGQILSLRSDILPGEYCAALEGLRTDVTPMPGERVRELISEVYDRPWNEIFDDIDGAPLGSASIAQVHAARLPDGADVVVKVQRPDIQATMERDLKLMKRASGFVKYTPIGSALDFGLVIDEMGRALREELDFDNEVRNLKEFAAANIDVRYVACPKVYEELSNDRIIVMEHVGGWQIDDAAGLTAAGYDLDEIAVKLVNNYIKQITVDRFFHADPHPGNIRVRDGKIIWLDLGMMGRLSKREAELYTGIITTIYENDAMGLTETLLNMCRCDRMPDKIALSGEVDGLLTRYKAMPMSEINISDVVTEFVDILNRYGVTVPSSLTMLGRSLLVIQGMLADVSPETNVVCIVVDYVAAGMAGSDFVRKRLKSAAKNLLASGDRLTVLPTQTSELIKKVSAGQLVVNVKRSSSDSEFEGRRYLVLLIVLCLLDCALILGAALLCLAPLPKILGLPWLASLFLAGAIVLAAVLIKKFKRR